MGQTDRKLASRIEARCGARLRYSLVAGGAFALFSPLVILTAASVCFLLCCFGYMAMAMVADFYTGAYSLGSLIGSLIGKATGWLLPFLIFLAGVLLWSGGSKGQRVRGFVTRHLALITRRNLPLAAGLEMVATDAPRRWRRILKRLESDVAAGQPLSSALARFPRCFPPAYISMVQAGETNGNLAAIFEKLKTYDTAALRFQRRATLCIVYPLTVLCMLLTVFTGIMVFIIPKMQQMYKEMNVELPRLTNQVIQMADRCGGLMLPALILIVLFLIVLALGIAPRRLSMWLKRDLLSFFPGYGQYLRSMAIARFCHTLSSLLDAGTPMVGALEAAASVRTGARIEKHLARLSQGAAEGRSLSAQMAASGGFPSTFQWMVSVGEQSGDLPRALARLADMYEASAGRMLTYMTRAIFPILIVAMGLAEAFVVLAFFMPLVKLAGGIGGG